MQITVEIPDSLAGQLHLGAKADLRSLLQALVEQRVAEGGLTVAQIGEALNLDGAAAKEILSSQATPPKTGLKKLSRPQRDVLARLRGVYGDMPMTGENAVLTARRMERY